MTPEDFREAIYQLRLKQADIARLFAVNDRSVRRWASEPGALPRTVSILLWLMLKGKITEEDIHEVVNRTGNNILD